MKISRDSWNIIQRVIRRYPDTKRRYQDALDAAMYPGKREKDSDIMDPDYTKPASITEAAALRLNSPYVQRLKKEIESVETVFNNLDSEEQSLICARFWVDRNKNQQYRRMFSLPFSERTMKRICRKFITNVGRNLGEVDTD